MAAAIVLAVESLVLIGVHVKYGEIVPIVMSFVLGLLIWRSSRTARFALSPIS